MRYQINSFEELDTQTLYEILSHRFEVFMLEQRCIYHDFVALSSSIFPARTLMKWCIHKYPGFKATNHLCMKDSVD